MVCYRVFFDRHQDLIIAGYLCRAMLMVYKHSHELFYSFEGESTSNAIRTPRWRKADKNYETRIISNLSPRSLESPSRISSSKRRR